MVGSPITRATSPMLMIFTRADRQLREQATAGYPAPFQAAQLFANQASKPQSGCSGSFPHQRRRCRRPSVRCDRGSRLALGEPTVVRPPRHRPPTASPAKKETDRRE
ncbi:hypothetical protein JOF42_001310 [Microbacterium phyllosphaerae]|uniref:Uncharacterized protein n=1 Tax=Microbacterium phyllosphaerae TaxID=124798 RepID=A0ABS4WNP1_9MICO|nr:hypothetical protein [Microbacterium phyllosphaerae]